MSRGPSGAYCITPWAAQDFSLQTRLVPFVHEGTRVILAGGASTRKEKGRGLDAPALSCLAAQQAYVGY